MPYIRINSNWIKDFNIRRRTTKLLEENMVGKLSEIALSNIIFWYISSGRGNKRKKLTNGTTSN